MFLYPHWWIQSHPELLNVDQSVDQSQPDQQWVDLSLQRLDVVIHSDNSEGVRSIDCPVLVLSARDDFLTPVALGDELAASIKNSHRYIFNKGGHFYPIVIAETFNQVVMDFLNNLDNLCPMQTLNH